MRVARPVVLDKQEQGKLEQLARGRSLPARLVERARIVLRAAAGVQDQQIASELAITPEKAARWRNRYLDGGIEALGKDASRPGRPRTITAARTAEVIHKTTQEKPFNATHWSTRTMAAATGLSETTVRRIWHSNGLKPHLIKTFKVSNDTRFAEKLEVIVGLYLQSTGTCHRSMRRREEPDTGAGPHSARITDEERPLRDHDSRLQTQRNRDLIRRPGRAGWHGDQHVRRPASPSGVAEVPARDRPGHAAGKGPSPDRRQLRHAQTSEGATVARASSTLSYPLHADQQFMAQHGRTLLPGSHRRTGCGAASFTTPKN